MKPWWDNPEYHSATVDNKIAAWAEHCRAIEQQLECVRDELMRVREVVGVVDAELIDAVLAHTANASVEGS
jgi:hypothetical protein